MEYGKDENFFLFGFPFHSLLLIGLSAFGFK